MISGTGVHRRSRWTTLLVALGLLSAVSVVGTVASPVLLARNPLLVVALSPRTAFLAIAAGHVPFPVFLLVAAGRLMLADPLHFLLGRHCGDRLLNRVERRAPRARSAMEAGRTFVARRGLLAVALRPTGAVLAAAGTCGLRPGPTAAADLVGTLVQVTLLYRGGRALALTEVLPRAALVAGLGMLLGALAVSMLRRRSTVRIEAARGVTSHLPVI